jgi:hypothetical protein
MIRHDALQRSLYAGQVERLAEHFDRSRILILQYERCVQEPAAELERTFAFLDLELPPGLEIDRRAPAPAPASGLPPAVEEDLRARLGADVARLAAAAPEIDRELWPECR